MGNTDTHESQLTVKAATLASIRFKDQVENMLKNFFAQSAPEVQLEQIGRERNVPRLSSSEGLVDYRQRVLDAFAENQGVGKAEDLILIMDAIGYIFYSYTTGFGPITDPNYFNILIQTKADLQYDATYDYDGAINYDAVPPNTINLEISKKNPGDLTPAEKDLIRERLRPVLRASCVIEQITEVIV